MRKLLTLLAFAALATSLRADDSQPAQWISLFNGTNLDGWTVVNGGEFSATNGVIHLDKGTGWLRTERQFTNFVFEAEWRALVTNYNSGFLIRAGLDGKPFPTDVWQVNLKGTGLGGLLRGSKTIVPSVTPQAPIGEWNRFRIAARGNHLVLEVNGERAWEFDDFDAEGGYIGLQAEGKPFEFRNLRVQLQGGARP